MPMAARRAWSTCSSRSSAPTRTLVVAIAVEGERQHSASEALGLRADAGRKRYQRALRRLRLSFEDFF